MSAASEAKPQPSDTITLSDYDEVVAWWRLRRTLDANGETMADAIEYLSSELFARKLEVFEEQNLQAMADERAARGTTHRGTK